MLPFRVGGAIETIEHTTLPVGDYGCRFKDGSSPPAIFERKSLGDLWGTMTAGYPRFKREVQKAKELGIELRLIIEAPLSDVLEGFSRSTFSGESMVQKLHTLQVRYKMPVTFCNSRFEMVETITQYFCAIGREYVAIQKAQSIGGKSVSKTLTTS